MKKSFILGVAVTFLGGELLLLIGLLCGWIEPHQLSVSDWMDGNGSVALQRGNEREKEGRYAAAVRSWILAADKGSPQGLHHFREVFLGDKDGGAEAEKMWRHLQRAADRGNADAQDIVGMRYERGKGVEQDALKALAWYKKAAAQGNLWGCYHLALCYVHGPAEDAAKAAELLRRVAEGQVQCRAEAAYLLASFYEEGKGVEMSEKEAAAWYAVAADAGLAAAQSRLGSLYLRGRGVPQDARKAFEYLSQAAEQEEMSALRDLAYCYWKGLGTPVDTREAAYLYRTAALRGDTEAQVTLGDFYRRKIGVQQSDAEALRWYRSAAEQGVAEAQFRLAELLAHGAGGRVGSAEAARWYTAAAEQGHAQAQYALAQCYAEGLGVPQDAARAGKWYLAAAQQGVAEAQFAIAVAYESGAAGVEKNDSDAARWFEAAAEQGVPAAQCSLARCYEYGVGVEQDDAAALKWYRAAAEQGHPGGMVGLGLACWSGLAGSDINEAEAVEFFRKAMRAGNAYAQYLLGICYEEGKGVQMDEAEAFKWYMAAADQCADAAYKVGQMYEQGRGVNQSKVQAAFWYTRALAEGVEAAADSLRSLE